MAKIMMGDYDHIRSILRDTYIYGCFTRKDFEEMGRNGNTFDKQKKKITTFIPNEVIDYKSRAQAEIVSFTYNTYNSNENYFAETYRYCTYNMDELTVYFNLLSLLDKYKNDKHKKEKEILLVDFEKKLNLETSISSKLAVDRKVEDMIDAGYVKREVIGNKVTYSLKDDILKKFDDEEIVSIYQMLDVYSSVSPFEIPYYFAKEKIKKYFKIDKYGKDEEIYNLMGNSNFLYKHNHVFNSIDNEIIYRIMKAIKNHSILRIDHGEVNTKITENIVKETSTEVIPVRILHECTYGRQYLIAYKVLDGKNSGFKIDKEVKVFRIDKLREIEILDAESSDDKVLKYKNVTNKLENSYITNGLREIKKVMRIKGKKDKKINKKKRTKEQVLKEVNKLKTKLINLDSDKEFINEVEKYQEFFEQEAKIKESVANEIEEYRKQMEKIEQNKSAIKKVSKYIQLLEQIEEKPEIIKELENNEALESEIDTDIEKIQKLVKAIISLERIENRILISYEDEAAEEAKKEEKCWTAGAINAELGRVKIKFMYTSKVNEEHLIKRLKNECREGKLERYPEEDEKGYYIYETEVTSATEMIPWIRSFGEAAVVVESDELLKFYSDGKECTNKIEDRMKENWNSLLESYENKEWENILKKYNKTNKKK